VPTEARDGTARRGKLGRETTDEARRPNSEARKPKPERSPKAEIRIIVTSWRVGASSFPKPSLPLRAGTARAQSTGLKFTLCHGLDFGVTFPP